MGLSVFAVSRLESAELKQSRFAGTTIHQRSVTEYVDNDGNLIARARPTVVLYDREAAGARDTYGAAGRYRYSAEELDQIASGYESESVRGSDVRYFDEVRA